MNVDAADVIGQPLIYGVYELPSILASVTARVISLLKSG
jgi:hypothetical protein